MDSLKPLFKTTCMIGLFVLGACAKPTEADCEKLADHVTDIMVNEMTKDMDIEGMADAVREEAQKERGKLIEECKTGSKAEVDCILKAESLEDIEKC